MANVDDYDMGIDFKLIKSLRGVCGIYAIYNKNDLKHYVGQTKDPLGVYRRWRSHRKMLRNNKHENVYLQNSYNKHGEGCFKFKILEVVKDLTLLTPREKYWIDNLKSRSNENGWNIDYFDNKHIRKQTNRENRKNQKTYEVLSPNKVKYVFTDIKEFKILHGLTNSAFGEMINGKCKSSKGWTSLHPDHIKMVNESKRTYKILSPDDKLHTVETPFSFMKNNGLSKHQDYFYKMLRGEVKYCKGWRLEGVASPPTKRLLSPWNEIITFTKNSEMCKKYNISESKISTILSGKRKSFKGWKLPYEEDNYHQILSPSLEVFKIYNVCLFAKEHNMHNSNLNSLLNGRLKSMKGWKLLTHNPLVVSTRT
jgi:group I intron endonuclease